jgi:hypothetical protein
MLRIRHAVLIAAFVVAAAFVSVPASASDLGVGFGGYAMTDSTPFMATTFMFHATDWKLGASFAVRTGESRTNVLAAVKAFANVKTAGTAEIGVGGSFAFLSNGTFNDDLIGLGLGASLEKRLGDGVALHADLFPLSFRFNGGTRVGILSSGSLGVTWYFSEN